MSKRGSNAALYLRDARAITRINDRTSPRPLDRRYVAAGTGEHEDAGSDFQRRKGCVLVGDPRLCDQSARRKGVSGEKVRVRRIDRPRKWHDDAVCFLFDHGHFPHSRLSYKLSAMAVSGLE